MKVRVYKVGDVVRTIKGRGVVFAIDGDILTVALDGNHGIYEFSKDMVWDDMPSELVTSSEEVEEFLRAAGIEISDKPTLQQDMDRREAQLRILDDLYDVVSELDERVFNGKNLIESLKELGWKELCSKGMELLKQLDVCYCCESIANNT